MNIIEQKTKALPPLTKMQSSYKMVVPAKVEEKIRYMLRKFPSTEWSGVLFFTHEGSFETDDLVITCQDIYPMDLGSGVFTEFSMSEDVTAYMADNIELFECDLGLCHSHHKMDTFFSGTDTNTLREEGNERNCFVSLIVNNAGKYNAAITRKIQAKNEITVRSLAQSYEFFGEGSVSMSDKDSTTTTVMTDEEIQYFMLDVEREEVSNHLDYIDERFREIEAKKKTPITINYTKPSDYSYPKVREDETFRDFLRDIEKQNKKKELTLFSDDEMDAMRAQSVWEPDPDIVHAVVSRMVTCSLNIIGDKFDLKQWIVKHLDNVYERVFKKPDDLAFMNWCDFIVEFSLNNFTDDTVPEELDEDTYTTAIADAMINELWEFGENPYIKRYISELQNFL